MKEFTGLKTKYYLAAITKPARVEHPAYIAECEDIMLALKLDYAEACIFKEIWRTANSRLGIQKEGHTEKYGAEKILHYAQLNFLHKT